MKAISSALTFLERHQHRERDLAWWQQASRMGGDRTYPFRLVVDQAGCGGIQAMPLTLGSLLVRTQNLMFVRGGSGRLYSSFWRG
jgi:hypothetical protein